MKYLIAALAFILLPAVAWAEDAIVTKLTDNVYSIHSGYYTSLVVIGDDGVLITDPANTYRAATIKAEIAKLTELPVSHIVLSHEHYDHVGGTEVFENALTIVQEEAVAIFELDALNFAPDSIGQTFEMEYSIDMGSVVAKLVHFGATSDGTANSIVHIPSAELVYSADFYEEYGVPKASFIKSLNSLGVREVMNYLVELDPKIAVASHSVSYDPAALHDAAAFYNALYQEVSAKLNAAQSEGYAALTEMQTKLPQEISLPEFSEYLSADDLAAHTDRMIESIMHGG